MSFTIFEGHVFRDHAHTCVQNHPCFDSSPRMCHCHACIPNNQSICNLISGICILSLQMCDTYRQQQGYHIFRKDQETFPEYKSKCFETLCISSLGEDIQ